MDSKNRLSKNEILSLQSSWLRGENSNGINIAVLCENLIPFFRNLIEYDVLEIGPGNKPVHRYFPCKSYQSADGYYPNDGLTVLRKKPDKRLVVVSFGVFDSNVLRLGQSLTNQYLVELIEEVERVTHPFSIICAENAEDYFGKPKIEALEGFGFGGVYLRHHE